MRDHILAAATKLNGQLATSFNASWDPPNDLTLSRGRALSISLTPPRISTFIFIYLSLARSRLLSCYSIISNRRCGTRLATVVRDARSYRARFSSSPPFFRHTFFRACACLLLCSVRSSFAFRFFLEDDEETITVRREFFQPPAPSP